MLNSVWDLDKKDGEDDEDDQASNAISQHNLCCDSWVLGPVIPLDISETQSVCPCSWQMAMMRTASMINRNCVILVAI